MISSASDRNRVLTRWLSASAVRFIGNQRFSITIEKLVSTSSATADWVRVSVSETSTSSTLIRSGPPSCPPACRSTALVIVRVTFHGSVSPNAHGQVAPVSSPAGPARRVSRSPWRPDSWRATVAQRGLAELTHRLG